MIIRVLNCPEDKCTNKCCDYNLGFFLQTMQELQELLKDKFDIASQKLLLNASTYADSETMNLQKVMGDGATTLCMWGNLSKNPR